MPRRRSITASVSLLVAALLALAGCAAGNSGSGGASTGALTIGYSTYTLTNPFFSGMMKGLEAQSKKNGYNLITTNANGDPAQQVTDIENLITRGAKYILLTPADGRAIAPAIAAADRAHIPIISIADSVVPPIAATVNINNQQAGAEAVKSIAAFLQQTKGKVEGNVVDIEGLAGTPSATQREQGFADAVKNYPGLRVVARQDGGYDTQKANAVMSDILQANPTVDAVFAANDAMAEGVTTALRAAGRFKPVGQPGHVFVIGVDGSPPSIAGVRAGVQDASISQNPIKMAEKAVDVVAQLKAGQKVDPAVEWPSQVITKDNIDSPAVKSYGVWADEV